MDNITNQNLEKGGPIKELQHQLAYPSNDSLANKIARVKKILALHNKRIKRKAKKAKKAKKASRTNVDTVALEAEFKKKSIAVCFTHTLYFQLIRILD
jgi:DNA-binding transcriptional MerR regulator